MKQVYKRKNKEVNKRELETLIMNKSSGNISVKDIILKDNKGKIPEGNKQMKSRQNKHAMTT